MTSWLVRWSACRAPRVQPGVVDPSRGLPGVVQGQAGGKLRAEIVQRKGEVQRSKLEVFPREAALGQKAAEDVDGIVAPREALGEVNPRIVACLCAGNSPADGFRVGIRSLDCGIMLKGDADGFFQAKACGLSPRCFCLGMQVTRPSLQDEQKQEGNCPATS
jgi:hypothetical protein